MFQSEDRPGRRRDRIIAMNKMLERTIAEAARLPEDEQETIASLILEEIEAERGWDERFAKSPGKLARLVGQARQRIAAGDVLPCDRPHSRSK